MKIKCVMSQCYKDKNMKKFYGFIKYWWIMYRAIGFSGIIMIMLWPNNSGNHPDYIKIWEDKSL